MEYSLDTPIDREALRNLRAGDRVYLSGTVYTARDEAHRRMALAIAQGEPLPFPLEGSVIYYVGPTPEKPGEAIGAAGPTTAGRMDRYSPLLLDRGNLVMIGKGKRSDAVKEAIVRNGGVYFGATGGAAALISRSIKASRVVAYPDLGAEAVHEFTVEDFPCVVIIDSKGNNLYVTGRQEYLNSTK